MLRVFIILLLLSLLPNGQAAYKIYDFAGNGEQGFSRESGPALEMQLAAPRGLAIDKAGSVYFIDVENRRVRKVDIKTGIMTIVVGCDKKNNTCKRWWNDEYNPKKYKVLETQLIDPIDVTIDSSDNLYILDRSDSRIYKVDKEGYIFPIVNKHGDHGYSGDDELSIDANINPNFGGISFDKNDNLYIADRDNNRVCKIDAKTKIITTVVGTGKSSVLG